MASKNTVRALSLDALRGIAILMMILSGSIPFSGMLPGWMYHAQVPPPDHIFNPNVPGITWVDLVFPFFLFAMGVAFPFALSKKVENNIPNWKISGQIILRGVLLAGFAIYIQHIKPYAISKSPDTATWVISILGFLLLFPVLLRLPASVSKLNQYIVKGIGLVAMVILLWLLEYPDASGFSLYRSDIIILVLANVAVFGSLIWLFTQKNMLLRLSILGFLIAMRLTHEVDGSWNQWLWNFSPFPWLYKLYYLQYLFIVLPGTIIGDMLLKWMKQTNGDATRGIPKRRTIMFSIVGLAAVFLLLNLIGLYIRELQLTLFANILLCCIGYYLFKNSQHPTEKLYKEFFNWGILWLLLGLAFEAYEGGIKKDHATMSYYFVTTGLAIFSLIALGILIDHFKIQKPFSILIANGQNPMIAYVAGTLFLTPVLALTNGSYILNQLLINPWLGFLKGLIFTSLVAIITAIFSKYKLYWRT